MKHFPTAQPVADRRLSHQDQHELRTLWMADGKTLSARVTKVESDGIQILSAVPEESSFINAADLCTADRVRYGFGTRKESAWVERMTANAAKQKSGKHSNDLSK